MAGGEGVVDSSDNTQELAELFDATLKFTSVLKKQGVSQSTLTVSLVCSVYQQNFSSSFMIISLQLTH